MIVIVEILLTLKLSARFRLVKSSNLRFQFSSDALTRSLSEVEVEKLGLVVGVSDIIVAFKQEFARIYLGRAERPTKEATCMGKDSTAFLVNVESSLRNTITVISARRSD